MTSFSLVLACEPDEEQSGSLENGAFVYGCISAADPQCPDDDPGAPTTAFPTIALGGTFSLTYDANEGPGGTVSAVSSDYFLSQGQTFTAIRSGKPAFVAESPDGATLDYTEVDVEPITSIHITDLTANMDDAVGVHTFGGTALGALGQTLGGAVSYEWSSSDPSVLEIEAGQQVPAPSINVIYKKSGKAKLLATSGTTTSELEINVTEGE